MKRQYGTEIGKLIKEYRVKSNLTQMELANKIGYEIPQFISLIENGHSKVPLNILGQMIAILNIPEQLMMAALLNAYQEEATDQINKGKKKVVNLK